MVYVFGLACVFGLFYVALSLDCFGVIRGCVCALIWFAFLVVL